MKVGEVTGNGSQDAAVASPMIDRIWRAALLAGFGGALGASINAARPDGLKVTEFAPPAVCSTSTTSWAEDPGVQLVSQAEALTLCAAPDTLIADVRSAAAFARGHVAGAIHLPCSASDRVASAAADGLSGKRLLLVYGDATDDAFPVAEQMRRRLGRADLSIKVLEGGFAAWSAAGLACTSGACPTCGASEHREHPGHVP